MKDNSLAVINELEVAYKRLAATDVRVMMVIALVSDESGLWMPSCGNGKLIDKGFALSMMGSLGYVVGLAILNDRLDGKKSFKILETPEGFCGVGEMGPQDIQDCESRRGAQ